MKTINLEQGSAEWNAWRARPNARNASEAPIIMGASKHTTRAELIRMKATCAEKEYSRWVMEVLFQRGHDVEPELRRYAENIAGTEFFPIVATSNDEYLSASFDGVSMDDRIICECKQWNADKIEAICEGRIPDDDYWQIVQQFAVCDTAVKCIYVVGDGSIGRTYHLEIYRDTILDIGHLLDGWKQFDADLAAYQHRPVKAAAVARPVEGFSPLILRLEGRVLAENLDEFRAASAAFLARLPKASELQTDQDFADAEAAVKACSLAETRIKAAKDAALAEMKEAYAALQAADDELEKIRSSRLSLDKAVKAEKENRKADLVKAAVDAVRAYYAKIDVPGYETGVPASMTADMWAAIKGTKYLSTAQDKLDGAVAQAKIAANMEADRRRMCIAVINEFAEHRALIPDASALVATKAPDDIRNLIRARIAEHEDKLRKQAEEAAERERERIRREEEARAQRMAEQERQRDAQEFAELEQAKSDVTASVMTSKQLSVLKASKLADALYSRGYKDADLEYDPRGCDEWHDVVNAIMNARSK